jgi:hypothetical protein
VLNQVSLQARCPSQTRTQYQTSHVSTYRSTVVAAKTTSKSGESWEGGLEADGGHDRPFVGVGGEEEKKGCIQASDEGRMVVPRAAASPLQRHRRQRRDLLLRWWPRLPPRRRRHLPPHPRRARVIDLATGMTPSVHPTTTSAHTRRCPPRRWSCTWSSSGYSVP